MPKPTTRQKITFGKLLRKIEAGEPFDLNAIMISSGYSKATARNPEKNLTEKNGWQQLLAQIDDKVILAKFYSILLDTDKRSSMDAGKELLKLKDRYPNKLNVTVGFFDKLEDDIDNPEESEEEPEPETPTERAPNAPETTEKKEEKSESVPDPSPEPSEGAPEKEEDKKEEKKENKDTSEEKQE